MAASQSKKRNLNFRQKRNQLLFNLGLGKSLHRNRSGKRIVAYQGVDESGGYGINQRFIAVSDLATQLRYFKQHFHVIALRHLLTEAEHDEQLTIALTFDGGYASHYHLVLPLLEELDLPATFFVTCGRALGQDRMWPDVVDLSRYEHHAPLNIGGTTFTACLLYTSPSPRDGATSRMPSSA